jgi:hypothetical protein
MSNVLLVARWVLLLVYLFVYPFFSYPYAREAIKTRKGTWTKTDRTMNFVASAVPIANLTKDAVCFLGKDDWNEPASW